MWKQFYKDTDIKINRPDKLHLLFYDKNNDHDSDLVSKYWDSRIENLEETEDLPWWTKRQKEQAAKELRSQTIRSRNQAMEGFDMDGF